LKKEEKVSEKLIKIIEEYICRNYLIEYEDQNKETVFKYFKEKYYRIFDKLIHERKENNYNISELNNFKVTKLLNFDIKIFLGRKRCSFVEANLDYSHN